MIGPEHGQSWHVGVSSVAGSDWKICPGPGKITGSLEAAGDKLSGPGIPWPESA